MLFVVGTVIPLPQGNAHFRFVGLNDAVRPKSVIRQKVSLQDGAPPPVAATMTGDHLGRVVR
ncbi:MAG: hypothetical protein ACJA2J_000317 [Candidatus Azotimanducaceae bacterium]|jgi:hypothetical protein